MGVENINDGTVNIRGKIYQTVALRVVQFREKHPDWAVRTKILSSAELVQVKAKIIDEAGRVRSEGSAEELRGSTNILKTSALETCETSAVGRALSFLGFGGTEIASADEVANAITQQKELEMVEALKAHNAAVRDHIDSISAIKIYLLEDNYEGAYEAIAEMPDDDKRSLWISTTAGGIWTTKERAQMKSDEWAAARKNYHSGEAA